MTQSSGSRKRASKRNGKKNTGKPQPSIAATLGKAMTATTKPTGLALLREPFPPNQISKLPKPYKKDSPKGNCRECGGYHGLPAAHLDYVGHAALTARLL